MRYVDLLDGVIHNHVLIQAISPELNNCFTYISAKGLNRIPILFEWLIFQLLGGKQFKYCMYILLLMVMCS